MRNDKKYIWTYTVRVGTSLLMICLLSACGRDELPANDDRRSITFILSSDSPGKNYFALATEHFSDHPTESTTVVTAECRSIGCVIDYLNNRADGKKWSRVNLVAHGNAKTGLNLYLSDGGHKATPKRMVQEAALGSLPRMSGSTVDSATHIQVYACGIGTNPLIALSMKRIFRSENGPDPDVDSAADYIVFRSDVNGVVQRLEAEYWPYYYKRGYRPSTSQIERDMQRQYPKDEQLWSEILNNPTDDGWTLDYNIPVSYTRIYHDKDARPRFDSDESKLDWVRSQVEISDKLQELDMQHDEFHWRVDRRIIKDIDGKNQYAVKAIGMATAICFLRER